MDASSKASVLTYTRNNLHTIIYKAMRPGEVEAPDEEKLAHMTALLDSDPALFLSRWGRFLPREQLEKFEGARGDYEVDFHLNNLLEYSVITGPVYNPIPTPGARTRTRAQIRSQNRRLEYLRRHLRESSYFSDEAMQAREPTLYEYYVGQYIPEHERNAPFADDINLVQRVLSDIDRDWAAEMVRKEREEQMEEEESEEEEDEEEDEEGGEEGEEKDKKSQEEEEEEEGMDEEEDVGPVGQNGAVQNGAVQNGAVQNGAVQNGAEQNGARQKDEVMDHVGEVYGLAQANHTDSLSSGEEVEEGDDVEEKEAEIAMEEKSVSTVPDISMKERQELHDEFVRIMEERFLDGEDLEFDYGLVDYNEEYDDMDQQDKDMQDRYFDGDDPEGDGGGEGSSGDTGVLDY